MRARRQRRWAWAVAVGAVLLATQARVAPTTPVLDGTWSGTVDVVPARAHGTAAGTLSQSGHGVTGTLTFSAAGMSGTFAAAGTVRGMRARISGALGAERLRWRAHWSRKTQTWHGPLVVRNGKHRMRGLLVLARDEGPAPLCGGDYFASDVMPTVMEPICSHCHVPGGQAQASPFRVTVGDPATTARSALREVDSTDPLHSKLLEKPLGNIAHGGGQRILPGSAEAQVLQHWITLVTAPGCGGGNPSGGGTGPELFADNCASCHGTDARGLSTGPDIHCSRSIADIVRSGRKTGTAEMPAFPRLADADIDKLQTFLDGLCPATTATGAELFSGNCAACHGADATGTPGTPGIRCATRVADAVRVGRGAAMPSIPALTDAEVSLVEGYLADLCTQSGRVGPDLWSGNCLTCHGEDARGAKNGLDVVGPDVHCSRNVATPVKAGQGTTMPAFPGLADADVATLQQYLTTSFCPAGTATGVDLYASNCASCHGADAAGTATGPDVRCATRVDDALTLGRGTKMPAFPGIAGADRAALTSYLVQLCAQAGRPAAAVYAANCGTCHGATAHGGKNGLDVVGPDVHCNRSIATPVKAGQGTNMPAFPGLTDADVAGLQQYLTASFCPAGTATGADLYASNCASCHGPDAAGTATGPDVRCATRVADALALGRGTKMPAFPGIGGADLVTLQAYLGQLCTQSGRSPATVYAGNCASCHGNTATGGQNSLDVVGPDVHCNRNVAAPVKAGQGTNMPAFPGLTDADVAGLQQYLTTSFCPPGTATGGDLYTSNCASCHGADAAGTATGPDVRCATRVDDALTLGRGTKMPAFPGIAGADRAALTGYLGQLCAQGGRPAAAVYAANCSTCHGATAHGGQNGLGVTGPDVHCNRNIATPVTAGQGTNMPAFPGLTGADVAGLQQYLTTSFCPAGTATGGDLYTSNCASCHGTDAAGTATGLDVRCATRVDDALTLGRGARMPAFPDLAGADRTALTGYLGQLCTQAGRPALALYAGNCASCHGADAHGGQNGLGIVGPDVHCNRSIATPVKAGQGTNMPAFSGLTDADVAALQGYLTTSFCPAGTATGGDLYASNCASCHGADARGVNGNPNIRCNRGIHDVVLSGRVGTIGTMPAFSMTDPEIALVQGYLVGLCPAGSASGSDLYAGNCATCHGTDAGGTATAPSVRCATLVADAVQVGRGTRMPSFPALVGTDLSSVEGFLAQLCVQHGRTGADLYAGNCSSCHGATAGGGVSGLGVRGSDIQCTGANDYQEAVRNGEDRMPRFPALGTGDVTAIVGYVHGTFCPGG